MILRTTGESLRSKVFVVENRIWKIYGEATDVSSSSHSGVTTNIVTLF